MYIESRRNKLFLRTPVLARHSTFCEVLVAVQCRIVTILHYKEDYHVSSKELQVLVLYRFPGSVR